MKKLPHEIVQRTCGRGTGNVVAVNGAGFDMNNGNVNTLFSRLNGAVNDARYEANERKVA